MWKVYTQFCYSPQTVSPLTIIQLIIFGFDCFDSFPQPIDMVFSHLTLLTRQTDKVRKQVVNHLAIFP